MEKLRIKKIESLLQQDLAEIFRKYLKNNSINAIVSVTRVAITPDLSIVRCHISIFPQNYVQEVFKKIKENSSEFRGLLGQKVRYQLRIVPALEFFLDDSLDYIEQIEKDLSGQGENPIKNASK